MSGDTSPGDMTPSSTPSGTDRVTAPAVLPTVHPTAALLITEARKLLAPVLTALIAAVAAGGIGFWRGDAGKQEAILEASRQQQELRELLRNLVGKKIRGGTWSEVGSRVGEVNAPAMIDELLRSQAVADLKVDPSVVRTIAGDEIKVMQSLSPQDQDQNQTQDR